MVDAGVVGSGGLGARKSGTDLEESTDCGEVLLSPIRVLGAKAELSDDYGIEVDRGALIAIGSDVELAVQDRDGDVRVEEIPTTHSDRLARKLPR